MREFQRERGVYGGGGLRVVTGVLGFGEVTVVERI